jgi:two-component system, NarL family, invasion response regulator UvrY
MIRILIADDHKLIRAGLKLTLSEEEDMDVICEAKDGIEALELVRENELDTVILDISMPGMNGLELSAEIRKQYPALPILILSVLSEETYASKSLKSGACGFVHKEKIPEELISAIRKVSAGEIYLSPVLTGKSLSEVHSSGRKFLYEKLSLVEFQVMTALASGIPVSEISSQFCLGTDKIILITHTILEKLELKDNSELLNYCIEEGLI